MPFSVVVAFSVAHSDDCRILEFNPHASDKVLVNHVFRSVKLPRQDMCEIRCYREPNCVSYNYGPTQSEKPWCDLNNHTHLQVSSSDFVTKEGYIYRDVLVRKLLLMVRDVQLKSCKQSSLSL